MKPILPPPLRHSMIVLMVYNEYTGSLSLGLTLVVIVIGISYFLYISTVSFVPSVARVVPLLWLAGASAGLVLGARTIRRTGKSYPSLISVILSIPSILFALIFAMAAAVGD